MCYNIYSVWSSSLWSIPFSMYLKNGVRMLFLFSSQLLSFSDKLHFYLTGLELDVLSSLQLSREPLGYSSTTCTLLFINLRRLKNLNSASLKLFFQTFLPLARKQSHQTFPSSLVKIILLQTEQRLEQGKSFCSLLSIFLLQFDSVEKLPDPSVMRCNSKAHHRDKCYFILPLLTERNGT